MALEVLYGQSGWFGMLKSGSAFFKLEGILGRQELRRLRLAELEDEHFNQGVVFKAPAKEMASLYILGLDVFACDSEWNPPQGHCQGLPLHPGGGALQKVCEVLRADRKGPDRGEREVGGGPDQVLLHVREVGAGASMSTAGQRKWMTHVSFEIKVFGAFLLLAIGWAVAIAVCLLEKVISAFRKKSRKR